MLKHFSMLSDIALGGGGLSLHNAQILSRLMTFVTTILDRDRRTGAKHHVVPHYEGHTWCDSLECQVSSDIATCRRPRL